jgi:ATP/maltotriose-dependent transcriptional regulator MalT
MRAGIRSYLETGARFRVTIFRTFLAEALASLGRYDEGLAELRIIDSLIGSTGERAYEAEVQRIRGEIFAAKGDERAERYLAKAISVANRQSARSLELRAIVSWMKLGGFGKREAYRARLADLYGQMAPQATNSDVINAKAELNK